MKFNSVKRMTMSVMCSLALGFSFGACSDEEEETPHEDVTAEDEGCEHMAEGPATAITATNVVAGAPAVANDHRRYDATLVSFEGSQGGFVSFESAEATDYMFFLSADVGFEVWDADDNVVAIEASEQPFDHCSEVAASHTLELDVGTYALRLGPTSETSVSLVIEEAGGHSHE